MSHLELQLWWLSTQEDGDDRLGEYWIERDMPFCEWWKYYVFEVSSKLESNVEWDDPIENTSTKLK